MRGGIQLLGGHGAVQFILLLRNFCIARLISPEEFGVAATFALTLSVLEAISDMSFAKLLIQDRDGDQPRFQAVLQALTLGRGLLMGAAIFAAAEPIARIFGVPEAADAYRWLALAPALKGFAHLDIKRVQRSLNFTAELRLMIVAQLSGLLVAVALAWVLRDYMAVLWGVLAQATVYCMGAHVLAERRYQLALGGDEVAKALRFGWPLMLNGVVVMLAMQGDRALVGARLSMTDLAIYTVASMLVGALQLPMQKITTSLTLPWMAAAQETPFFAKRYGMTADFLTILALLILVPVTLLGAELVTLVFGSEYASPPLLVGLLAFGAALRLVRSGPVVASLAVGDTKNLMLTSIARSVGILAAALALFAGGGLVGVAAGMCLGEFAACAVAMIRLRRVTKVTSGSSLRQFGIVLAAALASLALDASLPGDALSTRALLALAVVFASVPVVLWFSPGLLQEMRRLLAWRRGLAS